MFSLLLKLSEYPELDEASDIQRENPERALELCDRFVKHSSENSLLYHIRIAANEYLKNWEAALRDVNDFVRFSPGSPVAYLLRAEMAQQLGLHEDAVKDVAKLIALDKDNYYGAIPHCMLAISYAHLGNLAKAVTCLEEAKCRNLGQWFFFRAGISATTAEEFETYLETVVPARHPNPEFYGIDHNPSEKPDDEYSPVRTLNAAKISDEDLDALFLERTSKRSRKVAAVMADVTRIFGEWETDRMNARIAALVCSGKLISEGDITQWGYSEVHQPSDPIK